MSLKEEVFSLGLKRINRRKHPKHESVYTPRSVVKTGTMFLMIQSSILSMEILRLSFVLILQLIRPEKTFQISQLDPGQAAEPLSKLLSPRTQRAHWPSHLCVPNSLPISFWFNIQITSQSVLALFFCPGNCTTLAVATTTCQLFEAPQMMCIKVTSSFLLSLHLEVFGSPL